MTSPSEDDLFAELSQSRSQLATVAPTQAVNDSGGSEALAELPLEEQRLWYIRRQLQLCYDTDTRFETPLHPHVHVHADAACAPHLKCEWDKVGDSLFICRKDFGEHYCGWATAGVMVCSHRKDEDDRSVCGLTGADRGPCDLRPEAGKEWQGERIKYARDPDAPKKERTLADAVKVGAGGSALQEQKFAMVGRARGFITQMLRPDRKTTLANSTLQRLAELCWRLWAQLSAETKTFKENENRLPFQRFCAAVIYCHETGHPSRLIPRDRDLFERLRPADEMCSVLCAGLRRRWFTKVKAVLQACLNEVSVR